MAHDAPPPEDRWPGLVEAATFERMREQADRLAPNVTEELWRDSEQFFHRGASGQWSEILDDADAIRYRRRLDELADEDLIGWVHHGNAP